MFGHHSAELGDVTEVVGHPRSQELPQRHHPELWMLTFKGKLLFAQLPPSESVQVPRTKALELIEQRSQRLPIALLKLCEAVERREPADCTRARIS